MTHTEQERVAEIAGKLTKGQKRAVLSMDDGSLSDCDFRGLRDIGVIEFRGWRTLLTDPLGLAVRAHLQEQAS